MSVSLEICIRVGSFISVFHSKRSGACSSAYQISASFGVSASLTRFVLLSLFFATSAILILRCGDVHSHRGPDKDSTCPKCHKGPFGRLGSHTCLCKRTSKRHSGMTQCSTCGGRGPFKRLEVHFCKGRSVSFDTMSQTTDVSGPKQSGQISQSDCPSQLDIKNFSWS